MANDTTDHAHSAPGSGPDPAVSALMAAVTVFIQTLSGGVPFGAAGTVLEHMKAVRGQIDKLTFSMLAPLAQMETSGELLAEGGEKTIKAYVTHAWGIGPNEAERLMFLAQNLHNGTIPKTAEAIEAGVLTVGEAAAVAAGVEREVKKRDTEAHPDEDGYRAKVDTGMMGFKDHKASMSVKNFDQAAHALGFDLNPHRAEKDEQAEFAERGARLHSNFAGFTFEAWGPVSDGERLKAALASFMAPYGTTEQTNTPDGNGTAASGGPGSAGGSDFDFIPPGEAVTSRYGRTYDALICAMGFAHGHHGHHGHTNTNTSGTGAAAGAGGGGDGYGTGTETDADGNGSGGFASGGGNFASGDSADAADSSADADGSASGGGCTEPPGTKAVINITVPLSALMGFGFAFKNETNADGVGAAGAAGSPPGPVPGSGAGSGPDPGGGDGATNTNTGPPGSAGASGSPGGLVSSGLAVTEDGNVLALSAVRAMAPTAQIRRLIFDDRTGLPLDLGRAHRLAPGYLRTAAFIGHTTCAWSGGCDVPVSQCEADHITEFTHGGTTTAANLQPLCSTHNRLKYRHSRTENTPTNEADGARNTPNGTDGAEDTGTGTAPGA